MPAGAVVGNAVMMDDIESLVGCRASPRKGRYFVEEGAKRLVQWIR